MDHANFSMWILPQNFEAYHLPDSQILIILHNNWLWWMSPICPSCRSSSGMSLCWYLQPACKTINSSTSSVHVILSTILSAAPNYVPGLNITLPPKPLALIAIIQLIQYNRLRPLNVTLGPNDYITFVSGSKLSPNDYIHQLFVSESNLSPVTQHTHTYS